MQVIPNPALAEKIKQLRELIDRFPLQNKLARLEATLVQSMTDWQTYPVTDRAEM